MDLRHALLELAERDHLPPTAAARLFALARLDAEPAGVARGVALGLAVVAAALGGLGLIFWIAANWSDFGRAGRFGLLQALVLATCAGAALRPAARVPLSLVAMLGIGGLFAYFGQTYQTGADPWQLFAWWALLALPLCAGVKHDALWAPWALIVSTAIALWVFASSGRQWRVQQDDWLLHLTGWALSLGMVLLLSPALKRFTGAGVVAMRVALVLSTATITLTAISGLFEPDITAHFWLGLLILALAAAAFAQPRYHDTFALSVAGLGLNALLVVLIARVCMDLKVNLLLGLLLTGLSAAGLLGATVHTILSLSRQNAGKTS